MTAEMLERALGESEGGGGLICFAEGAARDKFWETGRVHASFWALATPSLRLLRLEMEMNRRYETRPELACGAGIKMRCDEGAQKRLQIPPEGVAANASMSKPGNEQK